MSNTNSNLDEEIPRVDGLSLAEEGATDSVHANLGREEAIPAPVAVGESVKPMVEATAHLWRIPEWVRASASSGLGEYGAQRLRSQREVIRDVMLSAADCETWLTLAELREVTRYGEASISAQLRHLRKAENGGYEIIKRHREGPASAPTAANGRADWVWEYCISLASGVEHAGKADAQRVAASA